MKGEIVLALYKERAVTLRVAKMRRELPSEHEPQSDRLWPKGVTGNAPHRGGM